MIATSPRPGPEIVDRRRDRAERRHLIHAVHHGEHHEDEEHHDVDGEKAADGFDDGVRQRLVRRPSCAGSLADG